MAAQYETPAEYIGHHLSFFSKPIGDGGFWTLNIDTLAVSIVRCRRLLLAVTYGTVDHATVG